MSPRAKSAEPELIRTEYASGLRIVTETMPGMRSVALGIWVDVGSRVERPAVAGASHFLEHLLFKGTPSAGPCSAVERPSRPSPAIK